MIQICRTLQNELPKHIDDIEAILLGDEKSLLFCIKNNVSRSERLAQVDRPRKQSASDDMLDILETQASQAESLNCKTKLCCEIQNEEEAIHNSEKFTVPLLFLGSSSIWKPGLFNGLVTKASMTTN